MQGEIVFHYIFAGRSALSGMNKSMTKRIDERSISRRAFESTPLVSADGFSMLRDIVC